MTSSDIVHIERSSDTVRVEQSAENESLSDDTFVINRELRSLSEDRVEELLETLYDAEVETNVDIPLYDLVNFRLTDSSSPQYLVRSILVYQAFEEHIVATEPTAVSCGDLNDQSAAAIADVAAAYDLDVTGIDRHEPSYRRAYLDGVKQLTGAMLDPGEGREEQSYWRDALRVTRLAPGPNQMGGVTNDGGGTDPDLLFVPEPTRPGSFRPVIERLIETGDEFDIYLRDTVDEFDAGDVELDRHATPAPLVTVATPSDVARVAQFVGAMYLEFVRKRPIERQLVDLFASQEGYRLERSVARSYKRLAKNLLHGGISYILAQFLFERHDYSTVVVGRTAEPERALLLAAQENDIRTFDLPHSVTTGYPLIGPGSMTRFVPGRTGQERLKRVGFVPDEHETVLTGRPRLSEMSDRYRESDADCSTPLRILIATQPWEDDVRREFLLTVLDAVAGVERDLEPVVKPHPGERTEYYRTSLVETDHSPVIIENGPEDIVTEADLVVTIDSNLGIESIAMGTPCLAVNLWSPLIRESPYLRNSPIPVLRSSDEVEAFFDDLTPEHLQDLQLKEISFVERNFSPGEDPIEAIVNAITG